MDPRIYVLVAPCTFDRATNPSMELRVYLLYLSKVLIDIGNIDNKFPMDIMFYLFSPQAFGDMSTKSSMNTLVYCFDSSTEF